MIPLLVLIGALSAAAILGSLRALRTDGYRQIPTEQCR